MSADPALYRALFEVRSDPMLVIEGERVVDANRRAQVALGERRDGLVGRKLAQLFASVQPDGRTPDEVAGELIRTASRDSPLRVRGVLRGDAAPFSALVEAQGYAFGDRRVVVLSWHRDDGQGLGNGWACKDGRGNREMDPTVARWSRPQQRRDDFAGAVPGAQGQDGHAVDAQARTPSDVVAVPVEAGGTIIGVLGLTGDPEVPLAENERQLLESISRQASEALQRAHLLEEARERARRERLIRDISDRMQRATDLGSLVTVAARSLGEALGASSVYVRMGMLERADEE